MFFGISVSYIIFRLMSHKDMTVLSIIFMTLQRLEKADNYNYNLICYGVDLFSVLWKANKTTSLPAMA